jgi:glycosyltransferase involved in cell wall biosynthesis
MRIALVNKYLYLRRGAEKHLLDVAVLLQQGGHQVSFFGMQHPKNDAVLLGIPEAATADTLVGYVGYNKSDSSLWQRLVGVGRIFWSFEAGRKMRQFLATEKPDVVHIHNIYHQLSFSILKAAQKAGVPVVMTVHDYAAISPDKDAYYPEVGSAYWKFLRVPKYSFAKRLLLVLRAYWERFLGGYQRYVSIFMVPSQVVLDAFVAAGVPPEKLVLLPHFYQAPVMGSATALDLPPNLPERYFLALTGASAEKGTPWLEEACEALGAPLVICGSVEPGYAKKQQKGTAGVIYAGHKSGAALEAYWPHAAAGVSASRLPETFGLVALESLAHGKPFVCFDAGAYKEIVRQGQDGVVAQTEEEFTAALAAIWNETKQYDTEALRASAEARFGSKQYLEQYEKVLSKVITEKTA